MTGRRACAAFALSFNAEKPQAQRESQPYDKWAIEAPLQRTVISLSSCLASFLSPVAVQLSKESGSIQVF